MLPIRSIPKLTPHHLILLAGLTLLLLGLFQFGKTLFLIGFGSATPAVSGNVLEQNLTAALKLINTTAK